MAPICPMSVEALRTRARSSRRATTVPAMSAMAARTQWRPTSMPTTQPAPGFSSYSAALGPLPPRVRPTSRTRSASASPASARETVGFDRPVRRATSARDTGPSRRISSSTERSFIARSTLGVPAEKIRSVLVARPPRAEPGGPEPDPGLDRTALVRKPS